ncbi:MAG: hypothetical protein U0736_14540 [Gemmataceae bacterium]
MSTATPPDREPASRGNGPAARRQERGGDARTGALDRADEQVEALFKPQYQTVNSLVHKAVWDDRVPLSLFDPPPLPAEGAVRPDDGRQLRDRAPAPPPAPCSATTARRPSRCSKNWAGPATGGC